MNIFYTQMLSHQGLSNNIFLLPKIVLICLALRTLKAIFMSYLLIPLSRATFYWWKRTDFSQRNSFLLLCLKLREWPFLMPCIEAEGTFTGYKNCTSSDPGIQHPRDTQTRIWKIILFIQAATGCKTCHATFYVVWNFSGQIWRMQLSGHI